MSKVDGDGAALRNVQIHELPDDVVVFWALWVGGRAHATHERLPAHRARLHAVAVERHHTLRARVLRVRGTHGRVRLGQIVADAARARLLNDAVEDIVHNLVYERDRLASRSRFRSSTPIRQAPLHVLHGLTRGVLNCVTRLRDPPGPPRLCHRQDSRASDRLKHGLKHARASKGLTHDKECVDSH